MLTSVVVIDDLDIKHVAVLECEADTPLVIDADTPLPFAISLQGFQTITWWRAHEIQRSRCVQLCQLALGYGLNGAEASRASALEYCLRFLAGK
jgi:hypothetical protein